jgi:hypothetical protein
VLQVVIEVRFAPPLPPEWLEGVALEWVALTIVGLWNLLGTPGSPVRRPGDGSSP